MADQLVVIPNTSSIHVLLRVWAECEERLPIVAWRIIWSEKYEEDEVYPITVEQGNENCVDYLVLPGGYLEQDSGTYVTQDEAVAAAREHLRKMDEIREKRRAKQTSSSE